MLGTLGVWRASSGDCRDPVVRLGLILVSENNKKKKNIKNISSRNDKNSIPEA